MQVIGIGMRLAFKHAPDHDFVKLFPGLFHAFHGGSGQNHALGVLFRVKANIHIFPEPFHRNFHV